MIMLQRLITIASWERQHPEMFWIRVATALVVFAPETAGFVMETATAIRMPIANAQETAVTAVPGIV